MDSQSVILTKNLRKSLLQGDPWIYRQAIDTSNTPKSPGLCKVLDNKKQFVGWGIYSAKSPLAVRMLSLTKTPLKGADIKEKILAARELRAPLLSESTDCYRLINGEGDRLPGLIVDVYQDTAVIQYDGDDISKFWSQYSIAEWLLKAGVCQRVYYKPRHDSKNPGKFWGKPLPENDLIIARENDCSFYVDIVSGQKTGFFLDQRENRQYVRSISKGKTILNLFSYSGGFSVYAGMGGAKNVTSADIAQGALDLAEKNWQLNNLPSDSHKTICDDVFEYLKSTSQKYDVVICDPPSLAKSEKTKPQAVQKYVEAFSLASKLVKPGGHLCLSSCSSHINFEDFNTITRECLSKARRTGLVLRISGQGPDHPFPHACHQLRYLKFSDILLN